MQMCNSQAVIFARYNYYIYEINKNLRVFLKEIFRKILHYILFNKEYKIYKNIVFIYYIFAYLFATLRSCNISLSLFSVPRSSTMKLRHGPMIMEIS